MRTANFNSDSVRKEEEQSSGAVEKTHQGSIDELIAAYADPIIKRVLLQRLSLHIDPRRKGLNQPEAEDLYQTVLLKLVSCLGATGNALKTQDIYEVGNYVATITHNVCNDFLRMKYPERNRLKNKLRDLIRRNPDFTCWMMENRTLCGHIKWAGCSESSVAEKLIGEIDEQDHDQSGRLKIADLVKLPLSKLVSELFHRFEGPVEIDNLVQIVAKLQGIKERLNESIDGDDLSTLEMTNSLARHDEYLEVKELLLRLWNTCGELPLNQRKAFIFTSHDYTGESILHRVLREQIVPISQIYKSLNLTREELMMIWKRLPMSTADAAMELGTSIAMIAKWRHRALRKLSPVFGLKR